VKPLNFGAYEVEEKQSRMPSGLRKSRESVGPSTLSDALNGVPGRFVLDVFPTLETVLTCSSVTPERFFLILPACQGIPSREMKSQGLTMRLQRAVNRL